MAEPVVNRRSRIPQPVPHTANVEPPLAAVADHRPTAGLGAATDPAGEGKLPHASLAREVGGRSGGGGKGSVEAASEGAGVE